MSIFDILIDMIGYTVARMTFPLVSLGRIHVQPLNSPENRYNALGCRYDGSGGIEIEQTVAGFLGFIFCLIAFFALGLLIRVVV